MSVAVAGATGGVGKAVVERLAREGVPTRALVRDQYEAVSTVAEYSDGFVCPTKPAMRRSVEQPVLGA